MLSRLDKMVARLVKQGYQTNASFTDYGACASVMTMTYPYVMVRCRQAPSMTAAVQDCMDQLEAMKNEQSVSV